MTELANKISDETIEYVGILAKLELSAEEKEAAKSDMEQILYYGDEVGTTIVSYIDLTAISIKQCDIIIRRVFISVYMNRYSVAKILIHIFCCQCTANFPAFLRFRDNFISIHIVFACNHKACFCSADYIVYITRVCIMKCFLRSRKGNKCVFKRNQVQQADSY